MTNPFSRVDGARTLWARADLNTDELEEEGMLERNADDGRTDAERVYELKQRASPATRDEDAEGNKGKRARFAASAAIRASARGVVSPDMTDALVALCLEDQACAGAGRVVLFHWLRQDKQHAIFLTHASTHMHTHTHTHTHKRLRVLRRGCGGCTCRRLRALRAMHLCAQRAAEAAPLGYLRSSAKLT